MEKGKKRPAICRTKVALVPGSKLIFDRSKKLILNKPSKIKGKRSVNSRVRTTEILNQHASRDSQRNLKKKKKKKKNGNCGMHTTISRIRNNSLDSLGRRIKCRESESRKLKKENFFEHAVPLCRVDVNLI
ncbi:hypothetical protein PUN28_007070 [Cardiocondyla obscurior]|uniref:Uncharacterized protein n=1 Tax=Cardiocondyla obscurior TaxID=286306 RepID=A0AAW2G2X3_9HYME